MDDDQKKAVLAKLAASRNRYVTQLPDKIAMISESWDALFATDWNQEQFHVLHRLVHTIAGSAGTFGLAEVGNAARDVEVLVKQLLENSNRPNQQQKSAIRSTIDTLTTISNNSLQHRENHGP